MRLQSQITIELKPGTCGVVCMCLPASKTDAKGSGVLRRQGCFCHQEPRLCPVAAAARIMKYNEERGGGPASPFLGTEDVSKAPTKQATVQCFRSVAAVWARPERNAIQSQDTCFDPQGRSILQGWVWTTFVFNYIVDGAPTPFYGTCGMRPWMAQKIG